MAEATELLKSMDATLKRILAILELGRPKEIATDLDGPYGNPIIKASDPRDWKGPSMKGRRFSECPPDYLEALASRYDYFADRALGSNETTQAGKPVEPYLRKDAARARGWAKRLREGYTGTPTNGAPAAAETLPFASETTDDGGDVEDF